ncbi:MAG: glycosyltransferase [Sphingobacteriaceae bacterium]|nr:MAG: glycosyltransferase [Sphingobacteriaceae bacterium]
MYNICIIKPNKDAFSETFIEEHIKRLPGNKKVLWGGAFPVYDNEGKFLIKSKVAMLVYLVQKRIFKQQNISVRNKALARYLQIEKIDVVLAEYGMVGAMVTDACSRANVPLVIHYHGADVHHRPTVAKYNKDYHKAFKYAAALITVSGDMQQELKKLGAPANKIYLNPYGVNTEKFSVADVSRSDINFLTVGRFVEKKSPSSVIKAFKIVADKFEKAHLYMVGTGALLEATRELANELNMSDQVTFTRILSPDEIQKLMQQTRCFVQHSVTAADGDMEGTPNTILEAGASGLAIVSTFHAGIKEAVIHKKTGFLVPEHDVEKMAAYMIKFAEDVNLAGEMGAAEAAHIRRHYDINDRIKTLSEILTNAIQKNQAGNIKTA